MFLNLYGLNFEINDLYNARIKKQMLPLIIILSCKKVNTNPIKIFNTNLINSQKQELVLYSKYKYPQYKIDLIFFKLLRLLKSKKNKLKIENNKNKINGIHKIYIH